MAQCQLAGKSPLMLAAKELLCLKEAAASVARAPPRLCLHSEVHAAEAHSRRQLGDKMANGRSANSA